MGVSEVVRRPEWDTSQLWTAPRRGGVAANISSHPSLQGPRRSQLDQFAYPKFHHPLRSSVAPRRRAYLPHYLLKRLKTQLPVSRVWLSTSGRTAVGITYGPGQLLALVE